MDEVRGRSGGRRVATIGVFERSERFVRRVPFVLVLGSAALLLVPWTVWLAARLPSRHVSPHWDVEWVGFDVGLTVTFAATVVALWRLSSTAPYFCTATGTLLLADAWFDLSTARTAGELDWALGVALLAELPLAVLCFAIVFRWPRLGPKLDENALEGPQREP